MLIVFKWVLCYCILSVQFHYIRWALKIPQNQRKPVTQTHEYCAVRLLVNTSGLLSFQPIWNYEEHTSVKVPPCAEFKSRSVYEALCKKRIQSHITPNGTEGTVPGLGASTGRQWTNVNMKHCISAWFIILVKGLPSSIWPTLPFPYTVGDSCLPCWLWYNTEAVPGSHVPRNNVCKMRRTTKEGKRLWKRISRLFCSRLQLFNFIWDYWAWWAQSYESLHADFSNAPPHSDGAPQIPLIAV